MGGGNEGAASFAKVGRGVAGMDSRACSIDGGSLPGGVGGGGGSGLEGGVCVVLVCVCSCSCGVEVQYVEVVLCVCVLFIDVCVCGSDLAWRVSPAC